MILTETHDLATLPDLNEIIILEYLKARYKYDSIYVKKNLKTLLTFKTE
jgi:myosin heavy subunit